MNDELEVWKDIEGYEGYYQVSNKGRVRSLDRFVAVSNKKYKNNTRKRMSGKVLSPHLYNHGFYPAISLCKDNKWRTKRIHRLVAEAFIPNPNNYPQINHIDGNKQNNCVENLEWCTDRYNKDHAKENDLYNHDPKVPTKSVVQLDKETNEYINRFDSIVDAANKTGANQGRISGCCKNKDGFYTSGGYKWMYEEDYVYA